MNPLEKQPSKFSAMLQARRQAENGVRDQNVPTNEGSPKPPTPLLGQDNHIVSKAGSHLDAAPQTTAPGKRRDPRFTQVTAYIPATLHVDIKMDLLRLNQKNPDKSRDFSVLVSQLLRQWHDQQINERS